VVHCVVGTETRCYANLSKVGDVRLAGIRSGGGGSAAQLPWALSHRNVGCGEVRTASLMFVCHPTIDAVRTAHRILHNHKFYRVFKKSDLSV
jgi:hypothetical protein